MSLGSAFRPSLILSLSLTLILAGSLSGCKYSFFKKKQPEPEPVVEVPPPPPLPKPALIISQMMPEKPQARGDAGAFINFINGTDLTVQYVMFKTTAYDRNGRIVHSKKSGDPNTWLRVAGPFAPGQASGSRHWEQLWQNRDLNCFEIEGVELIYMDGMVEFYHSDRLSFLPDSDRDNTCS
ncbi:hypothetical protein [Nitrincola tapanii]|uniref:Uncharacterized protein n=1 Tax=Nitrincola tapanii TaxID=1708751 RepID=A0A5A9W1N7_9GAMM|nr:hypothetical protein [Nitrincola tapanii]KAA0874636.1 hypothetical protein E1H14_07345 [Nitrincola tapanii]